MNSYFNELQSARLLQPELLWLLVPLGVVTIGVWLIRRNSPLAMLLRLLAFSLLVFALARPVHEDKSSKEELVAVIDSSYSVRPQARVALLRSLSAYLREGQELNLLPFGKTPARTTLRVEDELDAAGVGRDVEQLAASVDTGETNLGAAVENALGRFESSSIFVLSDGQETMGDAEQVARQAGQQGVRLFPLVPSENVFEKQQLSISLLHAPVTAKAGDVVEIRASAKNNQTRAVRGKLELWLDSEKLFSQFIEIPAAEEKLITIKTPPTRGGLRRVRAVLTPEELGAKGVQEEGLEKHTWMSVKEKEKLLLVSGSKEDQRILKQLLSYKGYALEDVVADGSVEVPETFDGFSSVILNNTALHQLPRRFLPALKDFVAAGGGLLIVGGDRSFGLGNYMNTPLEEISPLKFVPPQTERRRLTNAIALVIDKSGSMAEGGKIMSARQAALSSISALKDEDFISVIGFDAAPFVIIDLKEVKDAKIEAPRRLQNLTATGKTDLLPALAKARERLLKSGTSRKHIIVLSDGKFPLTDNVYIEEMNRLRKEGITVSAVALGVEADIPFMKLLAQQGKGAFYHTLDASQLPRIFVQDVMVATGERTMKEGGEVPVGVGPAGVRSTTVETFPPLLGFVETLPKKGSELELITKRDDKIHPVLGSWRFGSGKVVAYTGDANGRWSARWVRWPDFVRFWTQLIDGIKDQTSTKVGDVDFDLRYAVSRKSIVLDLALFDEKLRTQAAPRITAEVIEPGGEKREISFRSVKRGRFEGRIDNGRPGDYRLNISYGKLKLPALAMHLGGEVFGEIQGQGLNFQVLENIAYRSGGAINPAPSQVLLANRTTKRKKELFPPLVLLAFLLALLEAFVRERGVGTLFRLTSTKKNDQINKKSSPLRRSAMKTSLLLICLVSLMHLSGVPQEARADLFECNGTWTNKPCDSEVERRIAVGAAASEGQPSEDLSGRERSEKRSLLHELTMRAIKARDDYNIRIDLVPVQDVCLKPAFTVDQCRAKVNEVEEKLAKETTVASSLAAEKKAIELQEEANRLQRERNIIEEEKSNVVIVERPVIRGRPWPRPPRQIETSGSSIEVTGSSASGSVSGSISTGTSTITSPGASSEVRRLQQGTSMITDRPERRRYNAQR